MSKLWRLVFGVVALVGTVFVFPVRADFGDQVDSADPSAWQTYARRTEQLESELAALRQRLEDVESGYIDDASAGYDLVTAGWIGRVDYLNWNIRRQGLDFAIPTDDTALATGVGQVANLQFGQNAGLRAGLGYLTQTGWELFGNYTYFHETASAFAQEPAGGNLWATRSHPDRNQEASTAAAFGSFNYNVFDLQVENALLMNRFTTLRMFGGLRWANIDQDLRFEYDGRDFSDGVVTNSVSMSGFGARMGLDGYWHFAGGWSAFGRGAGSVMHGNFRSRLLETNLAGADTIVDIRDNYKQAVPVMETAVGGSWRNDWLQFEAGYEFINWFNLGNRSMFVDDQHEASYAPMSSSILLSGFFFRTTMLY